MARSLFDSQWTGFGGTCRSRKGVAGSVFGDHRPFQYPKELAVHDHFSGAYTGGGGGGFTVANEPPWKFQVSFQNQRHAHVFAIDHGRVSSHAHATFIQLSIDDR